MPKVCTQAPIEPREAGDRILRPFRARNLIPRGSREGALRACPWLSYSAATRLVEQPSPRFELTGRRESIQRSSFLIHHWINAPAARVQRFVRRHVLGTPVIMVGTQGRSITDKPDMSEGIDKPALPMRPPWHRVIPNLVQTPVCACIHCASDESVRILAKHLDACRRDAELCGALPTILRGLANEERCPGDFQTGH